MKPYIKDFTTFERAWQAPIEYVIKSTQMTYTLSIITSVLNAEDSIQTTLNSLFPLPNDVEWVFIDGGSTDNTIDRVARYCPPNGPLIYPNTTLYGGFNRGLMAANGKYVYYLNSGDALLPGGNIDRLVKVLKTSGNDKDVFYFHTYANYNNQNRKVLKPISIQRVMYRMPFSHQGCVVKRDAMLKVNGFDENSGLVADHALLLKLFLTGSSFQEIPKFFLTQCAPWGATEEVMSRTINRWISTRNLYKKYNPLDLNKIDYFYNYLISYFMNRPEVGVDGILDQIHMIAKNNQCNFVESVKIAQKQLMCLTK